MNYEMKPGRLEVFLSPAEEGITLQEFYNNLSIPVKKQKNLNVRINRVQVRDLSIILHAGDILTLPIDSEDVDYATAEEECPVLYEDDFVYIVHKDAGMLVHDGFERTDTLAAQAARYQINHGIHAPVRFIHRLDTETTGLMLFVKIPLFQAWYDKQLMQKQIHREYLAICHGKMRPGQNFTFSDPIGRDRHVSGKYRVSDTGKEAVTHVHCLAGTGELALLRCTLDTGRTHQIRVHLSAHKHPIINDPLYGVPDTTYPGMCLWADRITFRNPLTLEEHTVEDTPQKQYKEFMKKARR